MRRMRRQNITPWVKRNLLFGCIAERPKSPVFVGRMQGVHFEVGTQGMEVRMQEMQVRIKMARLIPVFPYTALKGSVFIPTYFSTSARFSFFMFMLSGM